MEFKTQIEKLKDATNWSKWKRQIELLLQHSEVLNLVIGVWKLPESLSESATAEQRTADEKS